MSTLVNWCQGNWIALGGVLAAILSEPDEISG